MLENLKKLLVKFFSLSECYEYRFSTVAVCSGLVADYFVFPSIEQFSVFVMKIHKIIKQKHRKYFKLIFRIQLQLFSLFKVF